MKSKTNKNKEVKIKRYLGMRPKVLLFTVTFIIVGLYVINKFNNTEKLSEIGITN